MKIRNVLRFAWRHSVRSGRWDYVSALAMGMNVHYGERRVMLAKEIIGAILLVILGYVSAVGWLSL